MIQFYENHFDSFAFHIKENDELYDYFFKTTELKNK